MPVLSACTAVGSYHRTSSGDVPLIDTASGGTWNSRRSVPSSAGPEQCERAVRIRWPACPGAPAAWRGATATVGQLLGLVASGIPSQGYWTNASDGGSLHLRSAQFDGSPGSIHLNEPVVGMAATPGEGGYWEVATDGRTSQL